MDIKSDIRRLNGTAASLNSLPEGPTALALNDRQMVSTKKIEKNGNILKHKEKFVHVTKIVLET